jgi:glutathione S-transferase
MIVVHHLNNSRSQRVLWLLEELGVAYEVAKYERDPNTGMAPVALRDVHPLGKSPVIVDDGLVLAESGAIIEYLLKRYGEGRLAPAANGGDWLRYVYWLHYAEGSAMPMLTLKVMFDQIEAARVPFFVRPVTRAIARTMKTKLVQPQIDLHLDFLEAELGKNLWFAGEEMTAADIQMSFPVQGAAARCGLDASRPRLMAFLGRIEARPAYRRSLERGGPYQL